jgi:hypothetical protein
MFHWCQLRLRPRNPRLIIRIMLLALGPFVWSCVSSTRFIPPNDGRVHLVMVRGQLAACRAGVTVPISGDTTPLFVENKEALQFAARAHGAHPWSLGLRNACLIDAINVQNDQLACPPEADRP